MFIVLAAAACGVGEPASGELRTDREGLAARVDLPPDAVDVRWLTLPARVGRSGTGRGDARVFAWIPTNADTSAWLTATLGDPLGPRAHWVYDEVGHALFTDAERAGMQHNDARNTWKLGCVRYPAAAIGRGEYRGEIVLDCEGHVYVAATAR